MWKVRASRRGLADEIAARQEKALIFTQFREMTRPLADFLAGVFGRPGLVLSGETQVKKRMGLVEQFQREDGPPFFVLSLKAGGTGLNLTAARHVIHFDRWWNPAVESQATDRAYRIGQRNGVLVHKFVCRGTVEEKIDALIESKQDLARHGSWRAWTRVKLAETDDGQLLPILAFDIQRTLRQKAEADAWYGGGFEFPEYAYRWGGAVLTPAQPPARRSRASRETQPRSCWTDRWEQAGSPYSLLEHEAWCDITWSHYRDATRNRLPRAEAMSARGRSSTCRSLR